jgi:predicted HTH domain antitoxin
VLRYTRYTLRPLAQQAGKIEFYLNQTLTDFNYLYFMKTLTFNVPDSFDLDDKEIAMLLATKLYEQGKLSLGQAAELVGLSKRTFAELLGRYNVSIFNYPASDLPRDIK